MSRQLPARPNLEHLKSQAKDLLDAHRRGEPDAFVRIRAAVPAFAHMADEALARAPFALHDAQSAIAREYGFASWADLRAHVTASNAEPAANAETAAPDVLVAAREAAVAQMVAGAQLPPEATAEILAAIARNEAVEKVPTPPSVPVLPLRNAVVFPGAVIPIAVNRPSTLRAIDAALATEPAFVAIFAQRAAGTETPAREDLHDSGCLCVVLYTRRTDGAGWLLVAGVRWVTLAALEQVDPYYAARVADTSVERDDTDVTALDVKLRATARKLAATMPQVRDAAFALIDTTQDIGQLADHVMASLPMPVDVSAPYAAEPNLARRLERVIEFLEAELAKTASNAR